MREAFGRLGAILRGDWLFYSLVLFSLVGWMGAIYLDIYIAEYLASQIISFNNVSKVDHFYTDLLLWTFAITAVQVLKYYSNGFDLYDTISIKKASAYRRRVHKSLQWIAFSLIVFCFAILITTFWVEAYVDDVWREYQFPLRKYFSNDLWLLDIKYLLVLFLLMDITFLLINVNYCKTDHCDDGTRFELETQRKDLWLDMPLAGLFILLETSISMANFSAGQISDYDARYLEKIQDINETQFVLGLQYVYVAMDLRRRITSSPA